MDDPIIAVIEKLAIVWNSMTREAGKEYGLSPLQIHILEYCGRDQQRQPGVTSIALEVGVTKPTISKALDTLVRRGIVLRSVLAKDKRRQFVELSPTGEQLLEHLTGWKATVEEQLSSFSDHLRKQTFGFLLKLIDSLQQAGLIRPGDVCLACRYLSKDRREENGTLYHCKLLARPIADSELVVECKEYSRRNLG